VQQRLEWNDFFLQEIMEKGKVLYEAAVRVTMSVMVCSRPSSLHMTTCNLTRMRSSPPVRVAGE
jgi:hypothetical protein